MFNLVRTIITLEFIFKCFSITLPLICFETANIIIKSYLLMTDSLTTISIEETLSQDFLKFVTTWTVMLSTG